MGDRLTACECSFEGPPEEFPNGRSIGLKKISLTCGPGTGVSAYEGCFPRASTGHNNRETAQSHLPV
ncbi:hypothetical protein Fuma_05844 [Fuerstiella marisgermanici]|uniref:Uncharacterized protein n=1 Tax=Fuerstiella marisgermanici TaxID=1891926 RepID=A0A1P8WQ42_9PLAN|nr:hypothetical protein Fuma_05844 [Fuerstiella marisgermanici]